ncbi:hypothetical protein [Sphingomonas endolithica]|uniref:hypothetical protein n=1 Tax=Sphingomonas endolithica TaxID=2972485 RepID=UPI0021AFC356|nr:hypothetical protein [Sphingomonas sp. ZFBP2030]
MGIFTEINRALAAVGKPSLFTCLRESIAIDRAAQADDLTVNWLASAIAHRCELSADEIARLLVSIAADGGPDLRTSKGMACASILLGVPGDPIIPTIH